MRATAPAAGSARRNPPGTPSHRAPRQCLWSADHRGTRSWLLAVSLALAAAAAVSQFVLGSPGRTAPPSRPLSSDEAVRLATMRQVNWADARAGVHATIGGGAEQFHATGWVYWRRPMAYLALSGPTPGVITALVQAIPGVVATRGAPMRPSGSPGPEPERSAGPEIVDPHPPPPAEPPEGGWTLRRTGAEGASRATASPATIDALVELLFTMAAEQPAAADLLAGGESRWLRRDRTAGHDVDVLLGPAALPASRPAGPDAPGSPTTSTPDSSLTEMGGAVRYWVDDRAAVHRVEALPGGVPVRVDLDRADRTRAPALDVLGGAPVSPRPVTAEEAERLSRVRPRNQQAGGGAVTLAMPTQSGRTSRATGWIDWSRTVAYLALRDPDRPDRSRLLWADSTGVAGRFGEPAGSASPLVPAPRGGWERQPWEARGDEYGGWDLDLLINEALSFGSWERDDPEKLRETAVWLRADELDGDPVSVYEIPRAVEAEVDAGRARLRYWVDDDSGLLRRLEIRTRSGGFAALDLDPGPVPYLGLTP